MSWIIFNGQNSNSFGKMESVPFIPAAEQDLIINEIPNGEPNFRMSGLKPIVQEFSIGFKRGDEALVHRIYGWLRGSGELKTSREPSVFFKAFCTAEKTPEHLSRQLDKINFTMTMSPYRYAVNNVQETVSMTKNPTDDYSYGFVDNQGTADALCEIELNPNKHWFIQINGATYESDYTGTIRINTEYAGLSKDGVIVRTDPVFARMFLKPGRNTIFCTTGVSVKITKNERWY